MHCVMTTHRLFMYQQTAARYTMFGGIDANDNLWVYGGSTATDNAYNQDLWMFDTDTNLWTWFGYPFFISLGTHLRAPFQWA
jgi:hypothetical protein